MGVEPLVGCITNALFAVLLGVVVVRAARQRTRAWIETALFFGCATLLLAATWLPSSIVTHHQRLIDSIDVSLMVSMALLLARLVDDMSIRSRLLTYGASAVFAVLIVAAWIVPDANSPLTLLPAVGYFAVVVVFSAVVMASAGVRSSGVTRRRTLAVAFGSLLLTLAVVLAGLRAAFPTVDGISHSLIDGPLGLAAGLSYFVGFATPGFLRRAWQDRVVREFFSRTLTLSRVSDITELVLGLETAARRSLGGLPVWLSLWDPNEQILRSMTWPDGERVIQPGQAVEGRVFTRQLPYVSANLEREDPAGAVRYRKDGTNAIICAPVSVGDRRFGVLAVFAPRATVFVDDDLEVVRLMADQSAIILESHELIQQSTRLRAREEATRLKDDFLAAAAHDLTNPLTAVLMQAQLIQRRAQRDPDRPIDQAAISFLIEQADRLRLFVSDLLDIQRIEGQGVQLERSDVDVADLVTETARRMPPERHLVRLELQRPVMVNGDRARLGRVVDNLLSNAVKYSPNGGEILVRLWSDGRQAHLTVQDQGIGIPAADLPHVFKRFQRGTNTDGTRLRGVGLGLFICKVVVEAHGGSISVTSEPGRGSEFRVRLPAARVASDDHSGGRQIPYTTQRPFDAGEPPPRVGQ